MLTDIDEQRRIATEDGPRQAKKSAFEHALNAQI